MIYFDNAATTPICEEAKAEMLREVEIFGNPSSLHGLGLEAERYILSAAKGLATIIGASANELFFTSGATESNNIAIFGAVGSYRRGRIVTSAAEHPSVIEPFKALRDKGFEVVIIPPKENGEVDLAQLIGNINEETLLVSVMSVNNETGALCDIEGVSRAVKDKNKNTLFHTDSVQAFAKHEINVSRGKIDLLSASGHKIGAPKGIGLLYVRNGVRVKPLFFGGGQQNAIRPGTENTIGIGAFAAAAKCAHFNIQANLKTVGLINDFLRKTFEKDIFFTDKALVNSPKGASPYILNVSFPKIKPEILMRLLEEDGVYVSTGAACSSKRKSGNSQRRGLMKELEESSIRFSFSPRNTVEQAGVVVGCIKRALMKFNFREG